MVYSAIKTPDGTVLVSRSVHDYKQHVDKNGKTYVIDGGLEYIRSSVNGDEKYIVYTLDDAHDIVRDLVKWGTYGKKGDQPLKYVSVAEMTTEHIEAVLENCNIHPNLKIVFERELNYRLSA